MCVLYISNHNIVSMNAVCQHMSQMDFLGINGIWFDRII